MFEDDGLFTPCHSDLEGTEGVNVGRKSGLKQVKLAFISEGYNCSQNDIEEQFLHTFGI